MGKLNDIVKECSNDVCGMRRVGGQSSRKGSEEMGLALAEKRGVFDEWLVVVC